MEHEQQLDFVFLYNSTAPQGEQVNTDDTKGQNVITFAQVKADRVKAELVRQLDRSGILTVGRRS